MKLQEACIACILNQARRVASIIEADPQKSQSIESLALTFSKNFSFSQTPPEVATPLYEAIAALMKTTDLYQEAKAKATKEAMAMLPDLKVMIDKAPNRFIAAAKMAVAGNVIDLATEHEYDLTEDVKAVLDAEFGIDDLEKLHQELKSASTLLYLADNAGEHLFDALFLEHLHDSLPELKIVYMTREQAIINDVTVEEAEASGLGRWAQIIKSGCTTPGFIYDNATKKAQEVFDDSDVVIAKGMGNFETMTERSQRSVYHLFKVKCSVVSTYVGFEQGSYIAMQRTPLTDENIL